MKVFKFTWENGMVKFVEAKNIIDAFNDLIDNKKLKRMKSFEEVQTMTMAEIAHKIGLSVEETIFHLRGLKGRPELRKADPKQKEPDLIEFWAENIENNNCPLEHAEEFIRRIKEHLAQTATA